MKGHKLNDDGRWSFHSVNNGLWRKRTKSGTSLVLLTM